VFGPTTGEELADTLRRLALHDCLIELRGGATKRRMGGALQRFDETVSLACLRRVIEYEPHDLTISVEAGLPWRELTAVLAQHRQMVPLDPPFGESATVGGVVAANCSGPRRRLYGTARDLVIGMQFATLEGKLVSTGGMVVKNVAGLDMGKLMIGSFGTLAALVSVNFKLLPMPAVERSFLLVFDSASAALAVRDRIAAGALEPAALDLLNPAAATAFGNAAWMLVVRAAGNAAAVDRYERELAGLGSGVALEEQDHLRLWRRLEEYTPAFLAGRPDGAVVRVSCTLKDLAGAIEQFPGPAVARAGAGVCYGYFESGRDAAAWLTDAAHRGWKAVMEFGPEHRHDLEMWPAPGGDLELMRRIKHMFDPANLLNRGRLYQRI